MKKYITLITILIYIRKFKLNLILNIFKRVSETSHNTIYISKVRRCWLCYIKIVY